jgi:iron complex outermembrane recepter protein
MNLARSSRLLIAALAAASTSYAEEPPVVLDPVIVTGSLPYDLAFTRSSTVTTYTGVLLEDTGITTVSELAPLVPGLFVSEQSLLTTSYNLRGITTDDTDPRVTQRVAVYQDGVSLAQSPGINVALFDLERVDVLKGPQPAAYGRAAQIGSVNAVTRKAAATPATELTAGFGDFNRLTASGFTNLPLIDGKLFARAAFLYEKADGYVDNLADNSELQGTDTAAFRASLRWQPSAATTADLIVNHQRDTPPGTAFKSLVIPTTAGDTDPFKAAELNRGRDLGSTRDVFSVTGLVTHTLNENWTASSTTAWRDIDAEEQFDVDGSRFFAVEAGDIHDARQFSQDVRFAYDSGDRFKASLGAGVFWQEATQRAQVRSDLNTLFTLLTGGLPPFALPAAYEENNINSAETLAGDLFADTSYDLTDRLTVGASLRVTRERLTSGYESLRTATPSIPILPSAGGGNSLFFPTTGRLESTDYADSWVGGLNASYDLTPRHTVYTGVTRGRRPPVTTFAQNATLAELTLAEEVVWNYEAGLKGTLAQRRIAYGLAAFLYDYDHFQTERLVTPGVTTPTDAGRARGQGFETTLQGAVNEHLLLFAAYGYTDFAFADRDEDGNPQAFAGNTSRLTSRHTLTLGATLTFTADDLGTFFVTPSWEYKSEHFFEDDNANAGLTAINPAIPPDTLSQGGYGLLHLRVGYRTLNNRWEVVLWARNLLDKDYLIDAGNLGANFGFPTATRGAPRMLGMNVTARF